jgi:hypothetical protein
VLRRCIPSRAHQPRSPAPLDPPESRRSWADSGFGLRVGPHQPCSQHSRSTVVRQWTSTHTARSVHDAAAVLAEVRRVHSERRAGHTAREGPS